MYLCRVENQAATLQEYFISESQQPQAGELSSFCQSVLITNRIVIFVSHDL
jgi:hypothetical protein